MKAVAGNMFFGNTYFCTEKCLTVLSFITESSRQHFKFLLSWQEDSEFCPLSPSNARSEERKVVSQGMHPVETLRDISAP